MAQGRVPGLIRLVRATPALIDAALAGDDALVRELGHPVVPGWATFTEALPSAREALAAEPVWGARLFVSGEPAELVGWGGFKGRPRDGVVELGYEIAADRRGRGLATAAAGAMLEEAFADERVTRVIAHTLAEPNASNRVLEKVGFGFDGELPQEGRLVWRYAIASTAARSKSP